MLEIISAVCGLMQSILIACKRKENWIFYLLNIVTLTLFSFQAHLYGDVLENLIYTIFGLLGLITWYSDKVTNKILSKFTKIRYCTIKERTIYISVLFVLWIVNYLWLVNTKDPYPILDALTTSMGFIATLMMTLKLVDSWIIWLVDDILMAIVYFSLPDKAIYLMTLNIIWVGLAIITWYIWHKEYKKGILNG